MTDADKIKAVETYLNWDMSDYDKTMKILQNIWNAVVEDTLV